MLHQRRALHDLATVLLDRAVAIERVDDAPRLLLVVLRVDDADGEAAFVEELLQPRADARELVVRQRVEDLEEKLIRRAVRQRFVFRDSLRVPVERAWMTARITQRLVDEAVAKLGLSRGLELRDDHGEDSRFVIEEDLFAEDLRPVGMVLADVGERALAKLLVADHADDAR